LVRQFWAIAENVRAKSFVFELGDPVSDDHLALNRVGIPAIDVIDFGGYKHWHKLTDTVDKCDAKQMAEVAKVTTYWLQSLK
jgi:glutaminyl-peptide cyclotransferase